MKDDISLTIKSYENSCRLVRERIAKLNRTIACCPEGPRLRQLTGRRYLLYRELWDMQSALRSMRDYVALAASREGNAQGCRSPEQRAS